MQNGMIVDLPLSPIAILAFLGSALCVAAGVVVAAVAAVTQRRALAMLIMKLMAAGVGLYAVLLLGASLISQERVLGRGVEKHYCEVDCHIAYSVTAIGRGKTFGEGANARTTQGEFFIVTLRTRFDETTIGPNRGDGALVPNPRTVLVYDSAGRRYEPVAETGTPMMRALRPGESYTTTLVFDLPTAAERPKLYVDNTPWPNHFLIGHEDSPLHKKAYFDISWM